MLQYQIINNYNSISYLHKFYILSFCAIFSLLSLPESLNNLRPDLFLLFTMYACINYDDKNFNIFDATFFGLVANIFYPVLFGVLGVLYATIYTFIKIFLVRIAGAGSLLFYLLSLKIILLFQIFFLLAYTNVTGDNFMTMTTYSVLVNFSIWVLIVNFKFKKKEI